VKAGNGWEECQGFNFQFIKRRTRTKLKIEPLASFTPLAG